MCTFVRLQACPPFGHQECQKDGYSAGLLCTQYPVGMWQLYPKSFREEVAASVWLSAPGAVSLWGDTTWVRTAGLLIVLETKGVF